MVNKDPGNERPSCAAMQSAVTEFTSIYDDPENTAEMLRRLFNCALASPQMNDWEGHERATAHDLIEDLIRLTSRLHTAAEAAQQAA
jgi:trimethylamine:corrinoid methyltransferase-like protein